MKNLHKIVALLALSFIYIASSTAMPVTSPRHRSTVVLSTADDSGANLGASIERALKKALRASEISNVRYEKTIVSNLSSSHLRSLAEKFGAKRLIFSKVSKRELQLFIFDPSTETKLYGGNLKIYVEREERPSDSEFYYYLKYLLKKATLAHAAGKPLNEISRFDTQTKVDPKVLAGQVYLSNQSEMGLEEGEPRKFYIAPGAGAAIGDAALPTWTTYAISLHIGAHLYKSLYLEGGIDHFGYNAFSLSAKIIRPMPDLGIQLLAGLGAAYIVRKEVYSSDSTNFGYAYNGFYLVPSLGFVFNLFDVDFKVEARGYLGRGGQKILVFLPGVIARF